MPADTDAQIRVPPQFIEGEQAILAGLLIDNDALAKVMAMLDSSDLYREPHRLIFQAMAKLFDRNEPVDWVTVSSVLQQEGTLDQAGGTGFLAELANALPSAANILHYARLVKEKAVLRRLIAKTNEINTRCYESHADLGEFLDQAEAAIFSIGEARIQQPFVNTQDLMTDALKKIKELYDRKEYITGVTSGFKDLDKLTAGFQPSDLIIIAGRPSMGKTSFALNVATAAAIDAKVPTAVFSLEMSKEQIGLRLLCSKAHVDLQSLRSGYLSRDKDWPRLATAAAILADAPLFIDDSPMINTLEVRAKARRLKKEKDLGLIVLDYLQLLRPAVKSELREQDISEISRSLKALAKEINVPVIALSQLNRKVEDRPNKRPQLADLRESGAIEQDADVILFIYRDEVYNKSPDNPNRGEAEIIIGKQRNGPIGMIKATFNATWSTFLPRASMEEPSDDGSAVLGNI